MNNTPHIPVMLEVVLENLQIQPTDIICDLTAGYGGHGQHIQNQLNSNGHYIGIDQDITAVNYCKSLYKNNSNTTIIHKNFQDIDTILATLNIKQIDKCLLDCGVSSHQLDEASRGFSHRYDANLDMRMNQTDELTAAHVLNSYSQQDLSNIFYTYGELKHNRNLVTNIYKFRHKEPLTTTFQLCELIRKSYRFNNNHNLYVKTCSKVFQAIRMEVNQELNVIKTALSKLESLTHEQSIIVILTFHSLEDRLVKHTIKQSNVFYFDPKKVIKPSYKECLKNSRSRSAKCRVIKKGPQKKQVI